MFVTVNTTVMKSLSVMKYLKGKLHMLIYTAMLRRDCRIVFGSELQKKMWTSRYRINSLSGRVIYNGVDLSYFDPEKILFYFQQMPTIYTCNRIHLVILFKLAHNRSLARLIALKANLLLSLDLHLKSSLNRLGNEKPLQFSNVSLLRNSFPFFFRPESLEKWERFMDR